MTELGACVKCSEPAIVRLFTEPVCLVHLLLGLAARKQAVEHAVKTNGHVVPSVIGSHADPS